MMCSKIIPNYVSCFVYPDINECETGSNDCHVDARCTDTQGSYDCTCKDGVIGDGVLCIGQRHWILYLNKPLTVVVVTITITIKLILMIMIKIILMIMK